MRADARLRVFRRGAFREGEARRALSVRREAAVENGFTPRARCGGRRRDGRLEIRISRIQGVPPVNRALAAFKCGGF